MGNPNNKKTGGSHALSITPHPEGHNSRLTLADAFTRAFSAYSTSKDSKSAVSTTQRNNLRARSRQVSEGGGKILLGALPAPPSVVPDDASPQDNAGLPLALRVEPKITTPPSLPDELNSYHWGPKATGVVGAQQPGGLVHAPLPEHGGERGTSDNTTVKKASSPNYGLVGWMFGDTPVSSTNAALATDPGRVSATSVSTCPKPAANLAVHGTPAVSDCAKAITSELTTSATAMLTGNAIVDGPVLQSSVKFGPDPCHGSANLLPGLIDYSISGLRAQGDAEFTVPELMSGDASMRMGKVIGDTGMSSAAADLTSSRSALSCVRPSSRVISA